ncbi:hypothetical protein INR49_019718 [Caranx melampygus]|nr:hypothetical protein INR49_019718 [Caranx melampygus]
MMLRDAALFVLATRSTGSNPSNPAPPPHQALSATQPLVHTHSRGLAVPIMNYGTLGGPVSGSRVRRDRERRGAERPYTEKPLNAFMLFLKEQRPSVMAELKNTSCCGALSAGTEGESQSLQSNQPGARCLRVFWCPSVPYWSSRLS